MKDHCSKCFNFFKECTCISKVCKKCKQDKRGIWKLCPKHELIWRPKK